MRIQDIPGMLAGIMAFGILTGGVAYAKEIPFPEGIYIGDLDLGGMTKAEVKSAIQERVQGRYGCRVTLDVDGAEAATTAEELGFSWTNPEVLEEAAGHVAGGNLIKQYMNRKDLERDPVHLELKTAVAPDRFEAFVGEQCAGLTRQPQNAVITRLNGAFQITSEVMGRSVDLDATRDKVDAALSGAEGDAVVVEAVITEQRPDITRDMLSSIKDMLGTFSTDFSSSGSSRAGNLKNGASKINGHVLMPGETLSGYECMHPFTTENGYYTAAAYENGQVVDSVGGGVCQIATTLYNAALQAELEITQRQNHSMIVTYVKPSMDAAIAGTYKDIKITNNYSTPIYVEGGTSGRTLTFTIYGKETRPQNRKVEYVSETLRSMDPGAPTVRVDPSLAPGTRRQVQSAHVGRKSRLWKVVTVDGVETERVLLHEDTYNPAKAIVLVGPPIQPPVLPPAPPQPEETMEGTQPQGEPETMPGTGASPSPGPGALAPTAAAETPAPGPAAETPAPGPETETPASGPALEEPAPSAALLETAAPGPPEPAPAPGSGTAAPETTAATEAVLPETAA